MTWIIAAHRSELAEPGSFVLLPWKADGELALTNIGGRIVAFDNRCHHRGARIFNEPRGNREPRCAYHGRLATEENVRRFPLQTWNGFVLVSEHEEDDTRVPLQMLDFLIEAPSLDLHSTQAFVMDCDWRVAIENALDFEHVGHVHGDSLAKLQLEPIALECGARGSSIETFKSGAPGLDSMGRFFTDERRRPDYVHAHYFPFTCLSSTRGWTYSLQHYFPRADGRTNFVHRLYAAPTTRPMPTFFDSVARMNERVFREDAAICARVPAGFEGMLGPREQRIAHFRRAL